MLKRNGHNLRHKAFNGGSLLTDLEQEAYQSALSIAQPELEDLATASKALLNLQAQFEMAAVASSEPNILRVGPSGEQWRVLKRLLKMDQNEVFLCQRGDDLAIIERFPENSAYARANSAAEIHLTGNDERLLLQDYVQNERQSLQMMARDLRAKVSENLAQRYPDLNLKPVMQAFLRRCQHEIAAGQSQAQSNTSRLTPRHGMRI